MFKPFKGSLSVMLWVASLIGLAFVLGLVLRGSPGQRLAQEPEGTETPADEATLPPDTPTPLPAETITPVVTATATLSPPMTQTPVLTETPTVEPTSVPTETATPVVTATLTPTVEPTPLPTETTTPGPVATVEPDTEGILFGSSGNLYWQPVDANGEKAAPLLQIPVAGPPDRKISGLYPAPDHRKFVYFVTVPPPEGCCEGVDTMFVSDPLHEKPRQIETTYLLPGAKLFGWHPDSQHFMYATQDGWVGLLDVYTDERIPIGSTQLWAKLPWDPQVDGLAFSPDDQSVVAAFTLSGLAENGGWEVWTAQTDGSAIKQLFTMPSFVAGMNWSPDGRSIAFVGQGVEVMDADGQHRRPVGGAFAGGGVFPAWSPDSRYLAFATVKDEKSLIQVVEVGPDTSRYFGRDLPGGAEGPAWSPDGKKLVFTSDWSTDRGASQVWMVDVETDGSLQLVAEDQSIWSGLAWLTVPGR